MSVQYINIGLPVRGKIALTDNNRLVDDKKHETRTWHGTPCVVQCSVITYLFIVVRIHIIRTPPPFVRRLMPKPPHPGNSVHKSHRVSHRELRLKVRVPEGWKAELTYRLPDWESNSRSLDHKADTCP